MTNFSMDLVALQAVNRILHREGKEWRLIMAAAVGTVFVILTRIFLHSWIIWEVMVHLMGNPLMLLAAYGTCSKKTFVLEWIWMYVLELLQGGLAYVCLQNTSIGSHVWVLWLCIALGSKILTVILRAYHGMEAQILEVQLRQNGKLLLLHAFYDTGNHLRDPFFGEPVQVLEKEILQNLVEEEHLPVRHIPFSAVGTKSGLLEAVTVDEMTVYMRGKMRRISPVVVAMAQQELFRGKEYQMLLNVDTLL